VAVLYGVQTMNVNQAVKNNPRKFPNSEYIFELTQNEKREVVENFENLITGSQSRVVNFFDHPNFTPSMAHLESKKPFKALQSRVVENFDHPHFTPPMAHLEKVKLSPTLPKAFTEKGLYMLATILKSDRAIDTTLAIIETFAKLKELQTNIALLNTMDPKAIQPEIIESTGSLLDEILFSGHPTSAKTSMELNLGIMKLKREITSEKFDRQTEFEELKKMMKDIREQNKQLLKKK
jgi:hypothetical protein